MAVAKLPAFKFGLITLAYILFSATARAGDPGIDGKSIQVSNITQESATVTWTTAKPSTTQVVLIEPTFHDVMQRFPENKADVSPMMIVHSVTLTGLIPDKEYAFAVISADGSAQGWRFPTLESKPLFLTFRTPAFDAAGATRFRIDTLAASHIYPGSDLYICIYPVPLAGKKGSLDLSDVSFDPPTASIEAHLINGFPNADEHKDFIINPTTKKPSIYGALGSYIHNPTFGIKLRLRIPPEIVPGKYTANLSFSSDGVTVPVKQTFEVLAAPAKTQRKTIAEVPPIPGLDVWKNMMVAQARRFGKTGEVMPFGYEAHVWYYDGGRVYLQIAEYTHDKAAFVPIAQNILNQYADRASTGIQGWRVFPHGLAMYYWRYGDERMKQAVFDLATKSHYARGGTPDPAMQRETAYIINALVKAAQVGAPQSPLLKYSVDCALGQFDILQQGHVFEQPFFDGLTMEALIDYYEYTVGQGHPDERIPLSIKKMLDWMWANVVDKSIGRMPIQGLPYYGYDYSSHFGGIYSGLNNLVCAAHAWYWNLTGDDTIRQHGDFLFEHALDEQKNEPFWSGKQFSQNYKASFDYVHYRSSAKPVLSLTDPSNNPHDAEFHPDNTPPKIMDIKVVMSGDDAVTITWTTDKPSTTQVRYASGASAKEIAYAPASPADSTSGKLHNVASHSVTIEKLPPKMAYHFAVMSRDAVGNLAVSQEQRLATLTGK